MSSVLERNYWSFLDCVFPVRRNIGGNEERHLNRGFLSDIANGFITSFSNSVSYLTQSLGCGRQNQLQVEPVTDFGSLHSDVDISEVKDPLHLGKAVKKRIEKDSTSIESLSPILDSETGSLHSAETLRSSRASSQAQQPAQSKRLRSCDRAEPQGKRMCRKVKEEDEGKKQNQKEEEKKQDQKKKEKKEQDHEEEDEEREQEKKEKQDQKKVDEQKEQEEKDENELMSNFFPHQWQSRIENV